VRAVWLFSRRCWRSVSVSRPLSMSSSPI
jgi:hypothetical protein